MPHTSGEPAWFQSWFDSPYYPILYKNRNLSDAEAMVNDLFPEAKKHLTDSGFLQPFSVLDVACGRGRHARQLHKLGCKVHAFDLSPKSVNSALEFRTEGLTFEVKDMRELDFENKFHLVVNFFTSFGYFDRREVNLDVLSRFRQALKPSGVLILDYFNAEYVMRTLVSDESLTLEGIKFHIRRRVEGKFLVKYIDLEDEGRKLYFREQVQLFYPTDFEDMFHRTGLELLSQRGRKNNRTVEFNSESERLILFARRPAEI